MKTWQIMILMGYSVFISTILVLVPWTVIWEHSIYAITKSHFTPVYLSIPFKILISLIGLVTFILVTRDAIKRLDEIEKNKQEYKS